MLKQDLCSHGSQVSNSQKVLRHGGVDGVGAEEQLLLLDGSLDWNTVNDILLRPVLDADKAKSELHVLAFNHALGASTLVHDVDFGDNANGTETLWIDLSSNLKPV